MEKNYLLSHGDIQINCVLNAPDYGEIRRVVLGVHGLGGGTEDEIQAGIAGEMEFFSSATLRFDFPAHGDSPMDSTYFTLENCRASLMTVAKEAKRLYPQVEDLCIFASGFGAYVTLVTLPQLLELPGKVKLVVQTPSVKMHETLIAMSRINLVTLEAMGSVTFHAKRPFVATYDFYQELKAHNAMVSHPIPMLILHGEADAYIKMEDIRQFNRINEQAKLVIIPGTSHRFLEEGAWDRVLDLTRDWFEFEQVLLSDWD